MATLEPSTPALPDLPRWLWLGLPLLITAIPYLLRPFGDNEHGLYRYVYFESGLIENATVLFLVIACIIGVRLFQRRQEFPIAGFHWWILLITLGSFYFAGEEISWGQNYFGWLTPEAWQTINRQHETNLHNTIPLLDKVPRNLLSLAALIGGILAPLYLLLRRKALQPVSVHYWLWPTLVCLPASVLALAVTLVPKGIVALFGHVPTVMDIKDGESKECLLALFMMCYLASLWVRLRAWRAAASG
ncbi:MAG: hypothetical protein U1F68_19820 [Gammaproteobacteria bacterium]